MRRKYIIFGRGKTGMDMLIILIEPGDDKLNFF